MLLLLMRNRGVFYYFWGLWGRWWVWNWYGVWIIFNGYWIWLVCILILRWFWVVDIKSFVFDGVDFLFVWEYY